MNYDNDVILASLKLSRAMRRCPPDRGAHPFPPAVGRLLVCASENPGVSSRELCEFLDLRPSSLSEILARAEADGLLVRTIDEADRRIQRITLSAKGQEAVAGMKTACDLDAKKKTSCLTDGEKEQFVALCNKLSDHIERLALDLPEDRPVPPPPDAPVFRHPGPGAPRPCPPDPEGKEPDSPCRPQFPPEMRFKC